MLKLANRRRLRIDFFTKPIILTLCVALLPTSRAFADEIDFVRDVRPIFQKHCYACHGEKKQKSGYRLDIKSEAFKGGDLYEENIIVPGKAAESLLVQFVADEDADLTMPPTGRGLSEKEIAILKRWVNQGAVWPDGVDRAKLKDLRDHWSFKPISKPIPPKTAGTDWPRNAIDHFIFAKLKNAKLRPAPETDRVSWLRRVSFDLTGLPPTPEQVAEFVKDKSKNAYQRVVDRLLKSPRYGERWAQHWLDVVRYADTHGFEVNTERPHAWPYRDYVIRSLNQDTPYDRFIRQQLVGDRLGQDAATGFLVTASVLLPGQIGKDAPSIRLARQDAIDEIVVNISQTFLGLSIGCARCHDHKFDPITQRDYYAMQAFVAGVEYKDRELLTPEQIATRKNIEKYKARIAEIDNVLTRFVPLAKSGTKRSMVNARQNTDRFTPVKTKRLRFVIRKTNRLEPCIDEIEVFDTEGKNIAIATAGTTVKSSGDKVSLNRHELKFVNDGKYGNSRSWMSNQTGSGWVELEFSREHEIDRVIWGRDRNGRFWDRLATDYMIEIQQDGKWQAIADASDRQKYDPAKKNPMPISIKGLPEKQAKIAKPLIREKSQLEAKIKSAANAKKIFAGTFRKPDKIHFLTRGDPEQPRDVVVPAVPTAFGKLRLPNETNEQQRRQALADWIASPKNPLTARVMVNRIWQTHFGTGLVATANDFGHSGQPPSHPELLDWLATEFIRSGWSIKHIHKLIVLSATYRQSSRNDDENAAHRDADVRLLWRYPLRRIDGESIRDSMLAVSGRLNLKMYGRGFNLFDKRGGLSGFIPIERFTNDGLRRMIYAHKVRRERDAVFGAFDCPDAGQSTPRRRESMTPIQALNLFNSQFTLDQANAFAARVKTESGNDVTRQIRRVYQLALNREPSKQEIESAKPVIQTHGLSVLCRAMFNSNEFLFLE